MIAVLSRADLTVGTTVTEFGNLNVMGIIGSWDGRGQVVTLNHQRQGGYGDSFYGIGQAGRHQLDGIHIMCSH